ncbi:iron (metal) dependent repressor, DtxR family [Methanohalobium evestigatum Z-7303]|uniref:Iron (Metal) dependent repressor, DtxR family n=1 Tax=Methanohalobium evestigatum (strain ATCC BAA-1072 / DSM 3721 / NBRC 107634 / OCM 161 / Z-7303) TaxID=644295 RepID=D7E7R5_METEZ|nr:metal-dependent transcriptional regulator [Methanohalobium evestigatum]ADI74138.1 iron (metal) dependent repressor, DtxR family [Methanohalobium evestigatum Z-7303]
MLSSKAEDYLEAILNLTEDKGYARIKDIAVALNRRPPSVTEMVKRLDEMGYVVYRKYEGITLTEKGKERAHVIKDRHDTLKDFLMMINVPENIADKDACTMEHELDATTIKNVRNFVDFVNTAPDSPQWLEHFKKFCKTGKHPCQ